jgi:hypothetical protein
MSFTFSGRPVLSAGVLFPGAGGFFFFSLLMEAISREMKSVSRDSFAVSQEKGCYFPCNRFHLP